MASFICWKTLYFRILNHDFKHLIKQIGKIKGLKNRRKLKDLRKIDKIGS